jgi:RNA polymerase sigma factor (TIGR02999 family)
MSMSDVTRILSQIEDGNPQATERLLPLVYDELRRLAAQKMAQEQPGQTLQATALVHEAYVRLVDNEKARHWNSRGHFYSAAAEALGIADSTATADWAYAKGWLRLRLSASSDP